jgi:predicted metal-dependent peptidase
MRRVLSKPSSVSQLASRRFIATGKAKLARAMGILLRSHPFHGHVASGWRARPESPDRRELAVGTMGVCWSCGGVQLIWNPEFVNTITDLELAGVLLHEVHHVVMRHPFLFPDRGSPDFDAYAALVAEEVTVNEFVSLPLPGDPFQLEQFTAKHPSLKPFESTRERYRKLYDAGRARRDHEERQQFQKTVEEQLEKLLSGEGTGHLASHLAGTIPGKPTDSHAGWGSFKDGGAAAALAVAVATAQAMKLHGHTLPPGLQKLLESLHAGGAPGTVPGGMLESLAGTARARLHWQSILRQLLAVDHDREQTYLRPPRRFPDLVGVLPGSRRVPLKLRILAAIDTSGSMSATTLDEIAAELRVMARSYDVAVVEFDAAIQRRYRLGDAHAHNPNSGISGSDNAARVAGDPLSAMQGRGGTSFYPVFQRDTLAWAADGGDLSGVVVFTDGFGPAPEKPPQEQVIWVLMGSDVQQPARWGRVVRATSTS